MDVFRIRQFGISILWFFLLSFQAIGQSSIDDLNVIFKHDFENNTLGNYSKDEWQRDFNNPEWNTRQSTTYISQDVYDLSNPTKALQINFPANSVGTDEGGAQWFITLDKKDELYVSYDLYFMPGFKFQLGGKLPSVQGGNIPGTNRPTGYNGFTGGLMFKEDGKIVFYIYYPDANLDEFGQSFPWGTSYSTKTPFLPSSVVMEYGSGKISYCDPGVWHNITYRMVLNSIKPGGGGNYDGILEAYFDGQLVTQVSHLLFRHTTDIGIDCMRIYSFFGGGDDAWRNPIDEWLKIDNVLLYTYKEGIDVPRGNTLSSTDRTINYWRKYDIVYTEVPVSPGSLVKTASTKSSVSLKWSDNSDNEQGFRIYRSSSPDEGFSEIGSVTANVNTFTVNSLSPSTTYYFKILAYNSIGNSSYTNVLSATTSDLQIPAAPTVFSSPAQTKSSISLLWTDNATNEQGYQLYRSVSATEGFTEIASLSANITSYTDNGLSPVTTYYYRLRAYNQDGSSSYTPILSVSTKPLQIPASPAGLIASHIGYTQVTLLWSDKAGNETGFELERLGPNNSSISKILNVPANAVTYTDAGLVMKGTYQYRIRAKNDDGVSAWSNVIEVVTPFMPPPVAPTKLKSTKFTDKSISLSWDDNSNNEESFIITRSLAVNPSSAIAIKIGANDTSFTDTSLVSSTTYQYTIKAVNLGGSSSLSNKNVATTLSMAELKRVKEGLVSYYNFGYNPDFIIYDQSGYGDPVDLHILNRSAVSWNKDNTIDILSNTALVSINPATKIVQAVKSTNEISFECWLKPLEPNLYSESRIVSLAASDNDVGFLLDQNLSDDSMNPSLSYSVRMQTTSTVAAGYPSFIPDRTQSYINLQHLVYTRDNQGMETMYLNGAKSSDSYRPSDLSIWKNNYYLRLGNESDMNHAWKGRYYSVAIYNKALSFDEVLINFATGPCDSLKQEGIGYQVMVYPNPATDFAFVEINPIEQQDIASKTLIRVMDLYGKVLYQRMVFNPTIQHIEKIDIRSLSDGLYILQVVSGNQIQSCKLIVQ